MKISKTSSAIKRKYTGRMTENISSIFGENKSHVKFTTRHYQVHKPRSYFTEINYIIFKKTCFEVNAEDKKYVIIDKNTNTCTYSFNTILVLKSVSQTVVRGPQVVLGSALVVLLD